VLLRAFFSVEIERQVPLFPFSFFFCSRFHTDGLNLSRSDAQYCHVVTVLTRVQSRLDICISARFEANCEVMPMRSFANF